MDHLLGRVQKEVRSGPAGVHRFEGEKADVIDNRAEPVNGILGDVGLVQGAAAVGANAGQGRLVDLIDLVRGRRLAVGLGAVIFAGLAAGLLGLGSGLALGEGAACRLPARVASSSWRRRRSFSACRSRRRR